MNILDKTFHERVHAYALELGLDQLGIESYPDQKKNVYEVRYHTVLYMSYDIQIDIIFSKYPKLSITDKAIRVSIMEPLYKGCPPKATLNDVKLLIYTALDNVGHELVKPMIRVLKIDMLLT